MRVGFVDVQGDVACGQQARPTATVGKHGVDVEPILFVSLMSAAARLRPKLRIAVAQPRSTNVY
eukprot:9152221-Prorocentrum_lima.AAC.1